MSDRKDELMRVAQQTGAAYFSRKKDLTDAMKLFAFGIGTIKQVDTATYLESEAYSRWLRASDAMALV